MPKLKPCPKCKDAWLYYSDMDKFQWKVNCLCGFAWRKSEWADTKERAAEEWNRIAAEV